MVAFINYTYEIVLLVGKSYNEGFDNWVNDPDGLAIMIEFSISSIAAILLSICLVYNLARWYLII